MVKCFLVFRGARNSSIIALCLTEKIHVLDKLHSDMSNIALELNVNDSIIHIQEDVFKQKQT